MVLGGGGKGPHWQGPPATLGPPPHRLRLLIGLLWYACLALALFSQAAQTWRVYEHFYVTVPSFASVGLRLEHQGGPSWTVRPIATVVRATQDEADRPVRERGAAIRLKLVGDGRSAWTVEPLPVRTKPAPKPSEEPVVKINGIGLEGRSPSTFAGWLGGEDGRTATIHLEKGDGAKLVGVVERSPEMRQRVYRALNRTFLVVGQGIDVLVAFFLLVAAAVLRRKKRDDPVAILLSFALLFGAVSLGTERLWNGLDRPAIPWLSTGAWIALFLIALPAFPSGRYKPAWTRWLFVAGPLVAALLAYPTEEASTGLAKAGLFVVVAFLLIVVRMRNASAGAELQQSKWAAVALTIGFLLFAIGTALPFLEDAQIVTSRPVRMTLYYLGYGLTRVAQLVIPAGLLFAIFGYRLNDADAALSRSTVFAAATAVGSVAWVVSVALINQFADTATRGNELMATGLSAAITFIVLAPATARAKIWAEDRFLGALVCLRSLPDRLARWQQEDDVETVANRALATIVEGIGAKGAVLVAGSSPPKIAGLARLDPEWLPPPLDDWPAAIPTRDFPLQIEMNAETGSPTTLLIGRRTDGSNYSKDQQYALESVVEPLADTLRVVGRRAARKAEAEMRLDRIEAQLDRLAGKA